jgi:hypothetical protein
MIIATTPDGRKPMSGLRMIVSGSIVAEKLGAGIGHTEKLRGFDHGTRL